MGQEFFVKSANLESKLRQVLPSQGGLGAGFDLSASTQIVPIVDLTEAAEGSNVRADIQTAFSHTNITSFLVNNTTSTLVNNTGYYRVYGAIGIYGTGAGSFSLTDGATSKEIFGVNSGLSGVSHTPFEFVVFLGAGDSLTATSTTGSVQVRGSTRQIATINGELVQPV